MDIILWTLVLVISLTVLVKASDYFTESAETIGLFFKLPKFIIGVTVVAIGTSLPELISSVIATLNGNTEIVVANVIGSNIANIFLILGVTAIVARKIRISYDLIHVDIPLFISSAAYLTLASLDGAFTFGEGILALAALTVYMLYAISTKDKSKTLNEQIKKELKEEAAVAREMKKEESPLEYITVIILVASLIVIFLSATTTVTSVIRLAPLLNIGTELIAVTAVALGTSLPELAVSLSAVRKGRAEMVIGNILGSNIFNAFGVMGVSSIFSTLVIPDTMLYFGIPVLIIASFLYFFKIHEKEITLWEGWTLVIFYIFFIAKTINLI